MASDNVEELRKKLSSLRRKAWLPIVKEGDGPATASKFSGAPWLSKRETWPRCPHCSQSMQLFLQLNLTELPKEVGHDFGQGLLQMFFCTNSQPCCDVECQGWQPFSECHLMRLVQPLQSASVQTHELVGAEDYFPAKTITSWREIDDYPRPCECNEHGVIVNDSDHDIWDCLDYGTQGDKLAGWPAWIQDVEYPNCRQCGRRMQMVFQLNSEDNLPYMFGDRGRGHITQCPAHKEELAFGWACT